MYTYNRIFVGIPLSQHDFEASKSLINELNELTEMDIRIQDIQHEMPEPISKLTQMFLEWVRDNEPELSKLNIGFHRDYHGADDYPVIFGVYVTDIFNIPSVGAARVDFSSIEKIKQIQADFEKLTEMMDPEVLDILKDDNLIGTWFNNHSS